MAESEPVGHSATSADGPRCTDCGRPLLAWDEPHNLEDCARFEAMTDAAKRDVEDYVMEVRSV